MNQKWMDLVINQPAGPLFDPLAQKILALGLVIFLLLWGAAKIIEAGRRK